jgi:hypothetical protein
MSKKKSRRRRTTAEKVMIVLSVLIALSMVIGLLESFAPQGLGG